MCFENNISSPGIISYCVPHGSVLWWGSFTGSLSTIVDNTAISYAANYLTQLHFTTQEDLNKLIYFFNEYLMWKKH